MVSEQILFHQLPLVLERTHFEHLGEAYEGKVRDSYTAGDVRYLIATDRLSCFDVVVTTVPFKGQVLTQLAYHWFKRSSHIVANHILDVPDPNVMVVRNCDVLPIEVVVRGYIAGSAWRDYQSGKAVSGVVLPTGLRAYEKLPEVIITPSTKAEKGQHDAPISEGEIIARAIVAPLVWAEVKEKALALFALGQREAEEAGLILVDTKYEFGLSQGKVVLVDEIHTLDSSRYWLKESYHNRFVAGEPPEMLDKEPTRQWLLARGYMGNGKVPEFTEAHRLQIAKHYIGAFEKISRSEFTPNGGDVHERIRTRLEKYKVPTVPVRY